MEEQLRSAVQAAGVASAESVERKAAELLRIMNVKLLPGTLRKAEICRHVLAVDLACRSLHVAYSAKKLMQISAVPEQAYSQALRICRDMLQLKVGEITIDRLAVMFNGDSVRRDAYAVLHLYRDKYLATLSAAQRQHVDLNSSAYQAAAFMIAAKHKKLKVDKKALLDAAQVDPSIFRNVCNSILRHIAVTRDESANGTSSDNAHDDSHTAAEGAAASTTRSSSKRRIVIKTTTTTTTTEDPAQSPPPTAEEATAEAPARAVSPPQSAVAFGHQRQAYAPQEGDPNLLQPSAVRKLLASMTPTTLDFQSGDALLRGGTMQSPPSVAALTPDRLQPPDASDQPSCALQAVTAGGRKPKRSLADFERMKEMIRSKRQISSPEQPAQTADAESGGAAAASMS